MMECARLVRLLLVAGCLVVMTTTSAEAYVDPGTGSYLIQIVAAVVLTTLFMIKTFWKSIKKSVARLFVRGKHSDK